MWNSILFPAELLAYLTSFSLLCFLGTAGYAKKRTSYPTRKPHKEVTKYLPDRQIGLRTKWFCKDWTWAS